MRLAPLIFLWKIIGPPGFEPGTSSTPRKRATRLRYGPYELKIVSQKRLCLKTKAGSGERREVEKLKVFFHLPLAPFHQFGPKARTTAGMLRPTHPPLRFAGSPPAWLTWVLAHPRNEPGTFSSKLADYSQLNCARPVLLSGLRPV